MRGHRPSLPLKSISVEEKKWSSKDLNHFNEVTEHKDGKLRKIRMLAQIGEVVDSWQTLFGCH